MIARIWHGFISIQNAEEYETLLKKEVFQEIESRNIEGFKNIQLLKRTISAEVEFITIMWFDTIEAVKKFAGDDYEHAVVPEKAKAILKRFHATSQHYELVT